MKMIIFFLEYCSTIQGGDIKLDPFWINLGETDIRILLRLHEYLKSRFHLRLIRYSDYNPREETIKGFQTIAKKFFANTGNSIAVLKAKQIKKSQKKKNFSFKKFFTILGLTLFFPF